MTSSENDHGEGSGGDATIPSAGAGASSGASGGAGGGRRQSPFLQDVAADVRALRDELAAARAEVAGYRATTRDTASLLAENLPRLDDLETGLAGLRAAVDQLLAGGEDEATTAARAAVGLSLQPATPWVWPVLDHDAAAAAWDQLDRWISCVLIPDYSPTLAELPECWPLHRRAVAELTWLRATYLDATRPKTPGHYAADWHTRWRPAAHANLTAEHGAIDPDQCWPGTHLRRGPGHQLPHNEREQARRGPCRPEHYAANLAHARALDLEARRSPGEGAEGAGDEPTTSGAV